MKKTIGVLLIAAITGLVACGPSAEEQAAKQKEHDDSLTKAMNDSMALVQQKEAEMQKAADDSIKMAAMQYSVDSAKAAAEASEKKAKSATTKPKTPAKPKNEPAPTDPTKVKPGQGRG